MVRRGSLPIGKRHHPPRPGWNVIGVDGIDQDVKELRKNNWAVAAVANEIRKTVDTENTPIFGTDVFRMVSDER